MAAVCSVLENSDKGNPCSYENDDLDFLIIKQRKMKTKNFDKDLLVELKKLALRFKDVVDNDTSDEALEEAIENSTDDNFSVTRLTETIVHFCGVDVVVVRYCDIDWQYNGQYSLYIQKEDKLIEWID